MQNILGLFVCLSSFMAAYGQQDTSQLATQLVDQQLAGYNVGDLDAFLQPYSDSVALYDFPHQLTKKGKDAMRQSYGQLFEQYPDLHCVVVNRMVQGNVVIDQERATFTQEGERVEVSVVAIYTIEHQKIAKVTFIYPED